MDRGSQGEVEASACHLSTSEAEEGEEGKEGEEGEEGENKEPKEKEKQETTEKKEQVMAKAMPARSQDLPAGGRQLTARPGERELTGRPVEPKTGQTTGRPVEPKWTPALLEKAKWLGRPSAASCEVGRHKEGKVIAG